MNKNALIIGMLVKVMNLICRYEKYGIIKNIV
jgi:hypothetical protein